MQGFPSAAHRLAQLPNSPQHLADGGPVGFGARGLAGLRDLVPKMAAMGYPQAAAPAPAPAADPRGAAGLRAMIPQVEAMGYKQASAPAPQYFARGGVVRGPGTGTSDSIETEAEPGTFIMPADSTEAIGPSALEQMGTMPVRLSDGEYQMPPEQVMAIGEAVLKLMKDATHAPVNGVDGGQTDAELAEPAGFAPSAAQQMAAVPEQRFADGGFVTDVTRQGNSYSGGNVGGSISVNGAAPAGTTSFVPGQAPAVPRPAASAMASVPSAQPAAAAAGGMPAPAAPAPATATAPAQPLGWQARNDRRNVEVTASSIMDSPERRAAQATLSAPPTPLAASAPVGMPAPAAAAPASTPLAGGFQSATQRLTAPSLLGQPPQTTQPRRFADGGMVGEEERRRLAQIPTGGQLAPAADGSQSNPLNTDLGRNAMNTLSALPGAGGLASRGGATAARATSGAVASAERAVPASWELVEGGGALASRAAAPAAQQMAQLPSAAGGPLARAANMAPQQAAPALAGPGGQLAQTGTAQAARGAMEFVERVPDAALGMSQAAAPAGMAARAGAGGMSRYATGAAGLGAAALLSGATADTGAAPTQPAGFAPNALAAPAPGPAPATAALGQMPGAAPAGMVTRDGNSYTGPANITGDVTINGAAPGGGTISAQNMAAADALAGRQAQESAARVMGQMPAAPAGFQAPIVRNSTNDWALRKELENARTSASSITNTRRWGGRGAENNVDAMELQGLLRADGAARAAQPAADLAAMQQNGETTRATLRERATAAQGAANRQSDLNRTLITERGNNTRAGIAADATTEAARARAAAAGQKPATEAERTAAGYTQRMIEATKYIDQFEDTGKASYTSEGARSIPKVGGAAARAVMSKEQEQYRQGQEDWVRAKLRKESGAVIGDQEMQREIETYFPMPGESPEVIQQKKASRAVAIDAMRTNAGTALPERYSQNAAPAASAPAAGVPPQISELQRRAANNPALAARLKELGY